MSLEQMTDENQGGSPSIDSLEAEVAEVFSFDSGAPAEPAPAETAPEASPPVSDTTAEPGAELGQAPSSVPVTPPVGSSEGEPAPAAPAAPTEPAPAATPPAGGAPAAAPAQPTPEQEQALRVQSLEAQVQALSGALEQARAQPAAGQPGAGTESGEQPQIELPQYRLTLPQQVAAAITSGEDEQVVAGVTHMMNSLATIVHHNLRTEMRGAFSQLIHSAQQQDESAGREQAIAAGQQQYYQAFPAHKDALIEPIIRAVNSEMSVQFPGLPWGPDYINALGARVNARLAALRGQGQPAAQPTGEPLPSAPAASIPAGARTTVPGSSPEGADLIEDTFSGSDFFG